MPYNEKLAARTRAVLKDQRGVTEKKMFGGLTFMLNGHMCCGVANDDLVVRLAPEQYQRALKKPHTRPMDFTGRPLKGMVYVAPAGVKSPASLRRWVHQGVDFVTSLTPNGPTKKTKPARKKTTSKNTNGRKTRPRSTTNPTVAGSSRGSALAAKSRTKSATRARPSDAPRSDSFSGFPRGTLSFLRELEANNQRDWFQANRERYEAYYVSPALSFVSALGPRLQTISKSLHYEPRINGSLFRIQRDVRFDKDKTPYKAHIDLWFWEGTTKGWDVPGFFFRLKPKELVLGAGIHHFAKQKLANYRNAVADSRQGRALERALGEVCEAGPYQIGGRRRKKVPPGFDKGHPRAHLLLHDGLFASTELRPPKQLGSAEFVDWCHGHFKAFTPLHRWLLRTLT